MIINFDSDAFIALFGFNKKHYELLIAIQVLLLPTCISHSAMRVVMKGIMCR